MYMYIRARKCNQFSNLVHQLLPSLLLPNQGRRLWPGFRFGHVIGYFDLGFLHTKIVSVQIEPRHNCTLKTSLTHNRQDGSCPNKGEPCLVQAVTALKVSRNTNIALYRPLKSRPKSSSNDTTQNSPSTSRPTSAFVMKSQLSPQSAFAIR